MSKTSKSARFENRTIVVEKHQELTFLAGSLKINQKEPRATRKEIQGKVARTISK